MFDDTVFTADDTVSGFALGAGTVYWTNGGAGGNFTITATPAGTLPSGGVTAQSFTFVKYTMRGLSVGRFTLDRSMHIT